VEARPDGGDTRACLVSGYRGRRRATGLPETHKSGQ
jgi:hypothetical protein